MSRIVKIVGKLHIENIQIARDAIDNCSIQGVTITNNQFVFSGYDYTDGRTKNKDIQRLEQKYLELLKLYKEKIAEEKRLLEIKKEKERLEAERKRLEELRRIEEEMKRIEEEKRIFREERKELIIKNAEKQGYVVKKEVTKDNTIKLVLRRRTY